MRIVPISEEKRFGSQADPRMWVRRARERIPFSRSGTQALCLASSINEIQPNDDPDPWRLLGYHASAGVKQSPPAITALWKVIPQ